MMYPSRNSWGILPQEHFLRKHLRIEFSRSFKTKYVVIFHLRKTYQFILLNELILLAWTVVAAIMIMLKT